MNNKINKIKRLKQYEFGSSSGQINISNDNSTINATYSNTSVFNNMNLNGIDTVELKKELLFLELKLAEEKFYVQADAVKNAISVNEEPKIVKFLKDAGQKSLNMAKDFGLLIAVDAIKRAIS